MTSGENPISRHRKHGKRTPTRVIRNIRGVVTDHLAESEHTSRVGEARPESLLYVLDSPDAQSVYSVVLDQLANPLVQHIHDLRIVRVYVGQGKLVGAEPALFHFGLVRVVRNETRSMILAGAAEWLVRREVERAEVRTRCGDMVHYDVHHEIHPARVDRVAEILQVIRRAKMAVQLLEVLRPVSRMLQSKRNHRTGSTDSPMVRLSAGCVSFDVGGDRGYPHRVKAHALNVVQLVRDTLPRATTVLFCRGITCLGRGVVAQRKPVRHNLPWASAWHARNEWHRA